MKREEAAGEGADRNTRGRVCSPDKEFRRRDANECDRENNIAPAR